MIDRLVDAGVPFKESFWGQPGWEPPYDDGLMYSGGENAAPFNTLVDPAPRGHVPQMSEKNTGEKGGGYMLMKPLVETAEKLGVRAEYDLRVQTLVVDGDRVVGVVGPLGPIAQACGQLRQQLGGLFGKDREQLGVYCVGLVQLVVGILGGVCS